MTEKAEETFWAQLVSLTDFESLPITIAKDTFVIGRNEDCDLSFNGNKLVSGKHCFVEKNDDKVWLYDTSTNGTLLNKKVKLSKGNRYELQHGDEIHVVYKKKSSEENIGYLFQEIEKLEKETTDESTLDYEYGADNTLSDELVNQLDESTSSDKSDAKHRSKRKLTGDEEAKSAKKNKTIDEDAGEKKEETKQLESTGVVVVDTAKASTSKAGVGQEEEGEDDMLTTLTCIICQDILHDCISLQPCMHSFCSGCYSEWMEKSNQCPSCRLKVDRINKNHLVNNLVEAYLKAKPAQKRPEEELKELDRKNKITRDMLYPDQPLGDVLDDSASNSNTDDDGDGDGERDSDASDDDDDGDNDDGIGIAQLGGFGTPFFGTTTVRPNAAVCRQCPNYTAPLIAMPVIDPDDEDAKTFPAAPPHYRCRPNQNHVLCLCCLQPIPDRRHEIPRDGTTLPPQQCALCYRSFCHAYWGCRSPQCHGCIAKFKDLNFGKTCLTSIIMENAYESTVLKDYLASQDMSVKNLQAECLAKLVTGEYTCINQDRLTDGINTPVCYACGIRMFRELALLYRLEIPDADLPREVTSRPNCYWGKGCRTQRNKPEHARRFNHVCEQTRTS